MNAALAMTSVLAVALLVGLPAVTGAQQGAAARRGPPVQGTEQDLELVARFDVDGNERLDYAERAMAREYLAAHPELRAPARRRRSTRTGSPGPALSPADVEVYSDKVGLYDRGILRTLFLEFEHEDWEQELEAFYHTDVEVAATLTVDGRKYPEVGVAFRGNNSFTAVPPGLKRQLKISIDFVHNQDLLGYNELKLLNANQDPTFMRTPLYLEASRDYIPSLKSNFVRVVINGESWGVYVSQQDFSKDFTEGAFGTREGTRWKSPNNSVGGGFSYLGPEVAPYREWYEMKGRDNLDAWHRLIEFCRVLNETPIEELEAGLEPILDIDGALRFLALDVALVNADGYWKDGSDFNIYLDWEERFHLTPHDANEGFRSGGRGGANSPDPLTTLDDPNKALRHRLLAVPALRDRYLVYVGEIAEKWLDWQRLGPIVEGYRALIEADVESDTRKLDTTEAFLLGIYGEEGGPPSAATLKGFAEARRAYLLSHPEIVRARGG